MVKTANISHLSTDAHNSSGESKKSRLGSSFLHRIQSSTHLIGPKTYNVSVQLLDDLEAVQGTFKKNSTGQDILDFVCQQLNIVEKEYFGLRYIDKYRYWVDLNAPLSKTFIANNVALSFRFRFYPSELSCIKEEVTRYQLFVQLQRDLLHGRLLCKQHESVHFAALILQAEQGDFDEEKNPPGYVSQFKLLLRQSERVEEKIAEAHKEMWGMSREVAIEEFLNESFQLQTFGINPYTVSIGNKSTDVVIGASSSRILVFVLNQVVYDIPWKYISAIDYHGKHLKLRLKGEYFSEYLSANPNLSPDVALSKVVGSTLFADDLKADKKMQLKFNCPSSTFAKHLWRELNAQQVFYNEDNAHIKPRFSKPKIPFITRGSTFRCPTSRVMREIKLDTTPPREIEQHKFTRYSLPRQKSRLDESLHSKTIELPSITVPSIIIETSSIHVNDDVEENPQYSLDETTNFSQTTDDIYNQIHVESQSSAPIVELHNEAENSSSTQIVELQNGNLVQNGSLPNGIISNGSVISEKVIQKKKSSLGRKIVIGLLDIIVLSILVAILVIVVFENLGSHEPKWFHPHISDFRSHYYIPWRSYVIRRYKDLHFFY